jgi:SsrA-binding protein
VKGLLKSVQTKGLTIVPLKLFTNEKDWQNYKLDFKGKKTYDKRESLKDKKTQTRLRPNQKII